MFQRAVEVEQTFELRSLPPYNKGEAPLYRLVIRVGLGLVAPMSKGEVKVKGRRHGVAT